MSKDKRGLDRSIRGSQLISPYGACAIYDFGDESFVIKSTASWPQDLQEIRLPRLEQKLGVTCFKKPLEKKEKDLKKGKNRFNSIEMMRFPAWLFCPSCRRMLNWQYSMEVSGQPPECPCCLNRSRLAPMRFVAVCSNGHLGDVPWDRWAHSKVRTDCSVRDDLSFVSKHGAGGSLASLMVRCNKCEAERDLADITLPNALENVGRACRGKHPWQRHDNAEACDQALVVLQRGASNVYFSEVEMALDISLGEAEHSELHGRIMNNTMWTRLKKAYQENKPARVEMYAEEIAEDESCEESVVQNLLRDGEGVYLLEDKPLKNEEWEALHISEGSQLDRSRSFAARAVDVSMTAALADASQSRNMFASLVSTVVLVDRLRVVRANVGFRRDKSDGKRLAPDLQTKSTWLPAVEVFGEGVFIALNEEAVRLWEQTLPSNVVSRLIEAHSNSFLQDRIPEPTPRYLLVHTLAHLLIRQLCYECGYSASSLAERLYVEEESMAGVLIYTASGDSEGALGGLVRQGESDRFWPMFQNALLRGRWCSGDPVCSESRGQGVDGLNQAACHACALVSETSCESMNLLLDRNMLFGESGFTGFFKTLTDVIETELV